jgi:hypothetical protein
MVVSDASTLSKAAEAERSVCGIFAVESKQLAHGFSQASWMTWHKLGKCKLCFERRQAPSPIILPRTTRSRTSIWQQVVPYFWLFPWRKG